MSVVKRQAGRAEVYARKGTPAIGREALVAMKLAKTVC